MQNAEIFLLITATLILILLLCQPLSVNVKFTSKLYVTIEVFPIKLILYDFSKGKTNLRNTLKKSKRFFRFLSPMLRSLTFLLRRTSTKILKLDVIDTNDAPPHTLFLIDKIEDFIAVYIYSIFFSLSKSATFGTSDFNNTNSGHSKLDCEFSTRFCNVLFAFVVFLFYSISKKGRSVKIVR